MGADNVVAKVGQDNAGNPGRHPLSFELDGEAEDSKVKRPKESSLPLLTTLQFGSQSALDEQVTNAARRALLAGDLRDDLRGFDGGEKLGSSHEDLIALVCAVLYE
ncbi:MAG: hypothetical protein RLZZ53_328 [Acidobacteriota bacterium]